MNIPVSKILASLFKPSEPVCFRVFDDKKGGVFQGTKLSCECGKYNTIEDTLKNHNTMNRGIFFVVNYGGQDDKSITRINAQFVEMDNGSFEEQMKKIKAFPLPPSMVIKTQKSYHVYWFMGSSAKVECFRTIQKRLVKHFDGDPMCVNESRVMRLPGFMHCKKDTPVEVTCVDFHPEHKYTQDQLSNVLPPEADPVPVEQKSGTEKGIDHVIRSCVFMQHCRDDAAGLSEPDWYAMITNLALFEGGTKMIHELSAPYPDYSEDNTQKKINHFLESGTKPITCKTICEKGFKCPKFATGKCPVKSPAAWCHQPMSADDLLDVLHKIPVTGEVIKDLQAARQFVSDYLYNQDTMTADILINSEIRNHFKLKASFLKPLNKVFKDSNRAYQASESARKAKTDTEIPDWYEPTNKGLRFLPGVLAKTLSEEQQIFYAAEQYYCYGDGVYREMSKIEAQQLVQKKMLVREVKLSQIIDAERQWRIRAQRDIQDLNANPYIINVRNGLYNVLEDMLTEHTPDYYSTVQLNVTYDKEADCPLFKKFLAESMGGDMEQVKLIQEMLGYFLIPVNSAQKGFILVGAAAAGKSVLLNVLNDVLLGRQNVSNVAWQNLGDRFKTATLFGKLANIFSDLPTKNIEDNGIFKALVGEDYLTVEKKNKDPFSFQSTARLLFSCNSIPKNYGDRSEGFYRRLIIIRFKHTVPQAKRDSELLNKFCMEANGIFLFALEGLRRLINNRYVFSETQVNADELQQYREESDSVLLFVKECCELNTSYSVGSTELFSIYKEYCEECGLKPCSQKTFVQQITTSFSDVAKGVDKLGKRRILIGIKLGEMPK